MRCRKVYDLMFKWCTNIIKKVILVLMLCLILTGCADMADYTISFEYGYRIVRLSAHQIAVYGEKPVLSEDKTVYVCSI